MVRTQVRRLSEQSRFLSDGNLRYFKKLIGGKKKKVLLFKRWTCRHFCSRGLSRCDHKKKKKVFSSHSYQELIYILIEQLKQHWLACLANLALFVSIKLSGLFTGKDCFKPTKGEFSLVYVVFDSKSQLWVGLNSSKMSQTLGPTALLYFNAGKHKVIYFKTLFWFNKHGRYVCKPPESI